MCDGSRAWQLRLLHLLLEWYVTHHDACVVCSMRCPCLHASISMFHTNLLQAHCKSTSHSFSAALSHLHTTLDTLITSATHEHDTTWAHRHMRLRHTHAVYTATLHHARANAMILHDIELHTRIMSFIHAAQVKCKLQLPLNIHSRPSIIAYIHAHTQPDGSNTLTPDDIDSTTMLQTRKQAHVFTCTSIDTFVRECGEFENALVRQRTLMAKVRKHAVAWCRAGVCGMVSHMYDLSCHVMSCHVLSYP